MLGAREAPFDAGSQRINEAQIEALAQLVANLCRRYGIPVTRATVLTHAEVQPTLGVRQRGKWDITWLPSSVRGQFYYWYMVKDVFSRKVVASEVHIAESSSLAAELLKRGTLREKVLEVLILHSDNGSAMKGSTMLATMQTG